MEETTDTPSKRGKGKYGGKSADARLRERKAKLIAAGILLFGRQGFNGSSIDALCAEAGLTKRYFYEAFSSREELLTACYQQITRDFLNSIMQQAAPHINDAPSLVHAGLSETFNWVKKHPDEARLMMMEAMSVRSQIGKIYGAQYDAFVRLLVDFTKPFLNNSHTSDTTLRIMGKATVGSIIHLCQGWIANDFKQPAEELIEGMERILAGMGQELGVPGWVDKK